MPAILTIADVVDAVRSNPRILNGPARPLRPSWGRFRAAWLVLTDRADALVWPEDERRALGKAATP